MSVETTTPEGVEEPVQETAAVDVAEVKDESPVEVAPVVESVEEAAPVVEKPKPEQYVTPKDTVDALRLIRKWKLLEADDDAETRMHTKNLVVEWISQKRAGITNQEWPEWYTTADLVSHEDDADEEVDPT